MTSEHLQAHPFRRGRFCAHRRLLLGAACLALLLAGVAAPQRAKAEEPVAQMERIQAEIDALIDDPNAPEEWLELQETEKAVQQIDRRGREEREPFRQRLRELQQTKAVQERQHQIRELYVDLVRAQKIFQGTLDEEGQRQIEERIARLEQAAMPETPQALALGLDVLTYPRVEGSTSTNPLALILACRILDAQYVWQDHTREQSGVEFGPGIIPADSPLALRLAGYRPQAVPHDDGAGARRLAAMINRDLTRHSGTHEAYVSIIQGESDIALIARAPSEEELALAEEHGVQLDVRPAARDAFVFINHVSNPVSSLTLDQIRDIYRGDIRNWSEIGGADAEITPYQREEQSGSQELMKELVMPDLLGFSPQAVQEIQGSPYVDPGKVQFFVHDARGMGGPYIALTEDPNGLAYSVYYYAYYMIGSPVTKLVAIDGVMPTYDTIRDKTYPLTADVYVVARKDLPENSPTARWREWLLSPEGQSVVRESGYVPVLETAE